MEPKSRKSGSQGLDWKFYLRLLSHFVWFDNELQLGREEKVWRAFWLVGLEIEKDFRKKFLIRQHFHTTQEEM